MKNNFILCLYCCKTRFSP